MCRFRFLRGFSVAVSFLAFLASSPCQEISGDETPSDALEMLLSLPQEKVDSSLQKNFTIVEPVHRHDLNPQTTSYSADAQILTGLYEGLFVYDPETLAPQPGIALSYRVSRDKKRWTFRLRENAKFSNGERITAESVRASMIQLLSTKGAPFASLLDIVRGAEDFRNGRISADEVAVRAVSDSELSVHLVKPAGYFPKLLCHSAFSVVHRSPTVYSGAFMLEDSGDGILVMEKNPYYWDAAATHLERITVIQSDDPAENAFMFNTGAADWIAGAADTSRIINLNSMQINAEFGTNYFFFKTSAGKPGKKASVWDNPDFRNALLEAVPWDDIRQGMVVPASTFVYPLADYPAVEGLGYTDSAEARSLMAEARRRAGISGEQKLPLVFDVPDGGISDSVIESLRQAWEPLGVEFSVRKIPKQYYLSNVRSSDADLFSYGWIGDFADPLTFLELFRSGSTMNDSGWSNSEYDRLIDEAASSDSERYQLLAKAESILLDSGMVIPRYHPVSFNLVNMDAVGGWSPNPIDVHPFKFLYRKSFVPKIPNVVMYSGRK